MNSHTLNIMGFHGLPRLMRCAIQHNLYGAPPPGKGNRSRRRAGLPVPEPTLGQHGQAMTVSEFNQWMNDETNR